jgi:hypothetical protein
VSGPIIALGLARRPSSADTAWASTVLGDSGPNG